MRMGGGKSYKEEGKKKKEEDSHQDPQTQRETAHQLVQGAQERRALVDLRKVAQRREVGDERLDVALHRHGLLGIVLLDARAEEVAEVAGARNCDET